MSFRFSRRSARFLARGRRSVYDLTRSRFGIVHLTLIDPLDGYYGTDRLDIVTGEPISEKTLRSNLETHRRWRLKSDELTLIKHLSTDARAIEAASGRDYDVLVIDGDHTYAGVKWDYENFAQFVRPGGYIIFDDYGHADWPDIKVFVDKEVSAQFAAGANWSRLADLCLPGEGCGGCRSRCANR